MDTARLPDIPDIPASIIESGIADVPLPTVVEVAMQRLLGAGVPIDRVNVGFRILHPLFEGMSITWTKEGGVMEELFYAEAVDREGSDFRVSPFYVMLEDGRSDWRIRLDQNSDAARFPLLMQLKENGFADYIALIVGFGGAKLHPRSRDGIATSWATRAPQGFSGDDLAAIRRVLAPLALVFRLAIKDQITRNALNTFHGPLVGGRILAGTIRRGEGERLSAALWYSDLRNSTGLADRLPVDSFLDLLNAYFDCACGAVTEQGGQVLDIIGDAILAFFPTRAFPAEESEEEEACALALKAAAAARNRLASLKAEDKNGARAIEFGIGVHFGDVVFGNAGTADRLKFGVLGRAVNEVARTADMAKSLRRPVVVSDEVARRCSHALFDLGLHDLRGIPRARRLWALDVR